MSNHWEDLKRCCIEQSVEDVRSLLQRLREKHGPHYVTNQLINSEGAPNGSTLLHLCVKKKVRDKRVIEVLIRFGASVDKREENGDTPLHIASRIGDIESIEFLLSSEHDNFNSCRAEGYPCTCGQKVMLEQRNLHKRLPKDEAKLSRSRAEKVLFEKEIFYYARAGKSPKFMHKLLNSAIEDVTVEKDFNVNFVKFCIKISYIRLIAIGILRLLKNKDCKSSINDCNKEAEARSKASLLLQMFLKLIDGDVRLFELIALGDEDWIYALDLRSGIDVKDPCKLFDPDWKAIVACLTSAAVELNMDGIVIQLLKLQHKSGKNEIDLDSLSLPRLEQIWLKEINNNKVEVLYLSNNKLKYLPKFTVGEASPMESNIVRGLRSRRLFENLTKLDVSRNKLHAVPPELFNLEYLRILDLSYNNIRRLPDDTVWSEKLHSLYLQHNQLNWLPKSIATSSIATLDLSYNKFENLPECVCNMLMLSHLTLNGNKGILTFPNEMGRMKLDIWMELEEMDQLLHPVNLLKNGTKPLLLHLRRHLYHTEQNCKMNLMVIGPWHSGKSALVNHIFERRRSARETKGIVLDKVLSFRNKFRRFNLQVVDFAGDIEFSTNQYFLTKRALYVLVWNIRENKESLKEWLNCLVTYVPGVHVVVVGTHFNPTEMLEDIKDVKRSLRVWLESEPRFANLRFGADVNRKSGDREIVFGKYWFNAVDCTFPSIGIKSLRKNIFRIAMTVRHPETKEFVLGERLPSFYLKVAARIKSICKQPRCQAHVHEPPILKYEDMLEMVRSEQMNETCLCCCKKRSSNTGWSADERDLNDAVQYLQDNGIVLHIKKNASLKNLYFIDIRWFQEVLLALQDQKVSGMDGGHLKISTIEKIVNAIEPNYPFHDGYIKFLQMFHIGFKTSKKTMQIAYYMKDSPPDSVEKFKIKSGVRYQRLHTMNYVPFGFWVKLISQILYYLNRILSGPEDLVYYQYDTADLASNVLSSNVHYWKKGFVYADSGNEVFISVSQIDVKPSRFGKCEELIDKAVILTEVITSNSNRSAQLLADVVDHIRTVIVEWHKALADLSQPNGVLQYSPCRICVDGGKDQPTLFCIDYCLGEYLKDDANLPKGFCCYKHSFNNCMDVSKVFPEFTFKDHPTLILRACHTLEYSSQEDAPCGGGGRVYTGTVTTHALCGTHQMNAYKVAVKRLHFNIEDQDRVERFFDFRKEVLMLSDATVHPNIVCFYGIRLGKHLEMIMEYAQFGALTNSLHRFDRVLLYRVAYQVADAIAFLHRCGMLYRDLKPDNILVFSEDIDKEINVKIGDFGTANYMAPRGMAALTGTPRYLPPEMLLEKSDYTNAVDVWCYSLVLYELVSKIIPFKGFDNKDIVERLRLRKRPEFTNEAINLHCLKELTTACWQHNPSDRPEAFHVFSVLESTPFQLFMGSIPYTMNVQLLKSYLYESPLLFNADNLEFHVLNLQTRKVGNPQNLKQVRRQTQLRGQMNAFVDANVILSFAFIDQRHVTFLITTDNTTRLIVIHLSDSHVGADDQTTEGEYTVIFSTIMPWVTWTRDFTDFDQKPYKVLSNKHSSVLCFENSLMVLSGFENGVYANEMHPLSKLEKSFSDVLLVNDILVVVYKDHLRVMKIFPGGLISAEHQEPFKHRVTKVFACQNYLLITFNKTSELSILQLDCDATPAEVLNTFTYDTNANAGLSKVERITTFCYVNRLFWVGTDHGTVLLFHCDNQALVLLKKMRPYTDRVNYMIAKEINGITTVVTHGGNLNYGAFFYDGSHNHHFKFHRKFLGFSQREDDDQCDDLLLLWYAPSRKELSRFPVGNQSKKVKGRMESVVEDLTKECSMSS